MKVLWFEVSEPSAYVSGGSPIGGWQDSLERIVRTVPEIELTISFVSEKYSIVKKIGGVTYNPIYIRKNSFERKFYNYYDLYVKKVIPKAREVVKRCDPDLIQVFGTEWPLGQIAAYTNKPVVVHIMGAIVPYNNANYPPNYSYASLIWHNKWRLINLFHLWQNKRNSESGEKWERRTWKLISNYMGRTKWDESISRLMHPGRNYFHVDEALRVDFIKGIYKWNTLSGRKIRLFSTGCSSYWKGPDMMLKVAKILKAQNICFEWLVAGRMSSTIKQMVEWNESTKYEDCNVVFLGYKNSDELVQLLCSSTLYIHTAYIENSPNSICEAQCVGLPVISTNVGGISTLVRQDIDGVLVPANDPWQMADAIVELCKDKDRMKRYSASSRTFALSRHNDEKIKQQLLSCYNKILNCS